MDLRKNRRGFTLLEIIIVIIIVGVLASLALPRFMSLIESSRQTEALVNITSIRQALERVYIMKISSGGTDSITAGPDPAYDKWNQLAIDNPNLSPNAHFAYIAQVNPSEGGIVVVALRNCRDNGHVGGSTLGENSNVIYLVVDNVHNETNLCGFGYYKQLNMGGGGRCDYGWMGWFSPGDLSVLAEMYNNYSSLCPG